MANGPAGRKCSIGAAFVVAFVADIGHDGRLAIVPAVRRQCRRVSRIEERAPSAATRSRAADRRAVRKAPMTREFSRVTPTRPSDGGDLPPPGGVEVRRPCAAPPRSPSLRARRSGSGSRSYGRKARPARLRRAKVRNTGRTASSSRLSVTTMSRIGCASSATLSQTPSVSNSRRAAATIAEARSSPAWLWPERRVGDRDGERRPERLPQRDRERQPGKAAAGDQHVDMVGRAW